MPKIDRVTLTKIAPDPKSVKALEDLFKESTDNASEIAKVTKLANDAQITANAANLTAGQALTAANSASSDAATALSAANSATAQINIIESPAGAHAVGFVPSNNVSGNNVQDAITSLDMNDGSGFRNIAINGSFIVNQRNYVSGTPTTAANQYTLDRWRVVVSGQGLTFTATSNGNLVTAPAGGMEQIIEGALIVQPTYVIGWLGTATCTVDGVAKVKGSVLTLTPSTNCSVKFFGGSVGSFQLEQGRTVHPFEPRPYAVELWLCQRYAFRWTAVGTIGVCNASGGSYSVVFPNMMRIAPTFTIVTQSAFGDGMGFFPVSAQSQSFSDARSSYMDFTASGTTPGRAALFIAGGVGLYSAEF